MLKIMKIHLLTVAFFVIAIDAKRLVKRQVIKFNGKIISGPKSDCATPDGIEGTCVELRKCKPLNDQLRSAPTPNFLSFLEKSVCRYIRRVPIICCANNVTPQVTRLLPLIEETPPASTGFALLPRSCGIVNANSRKIVGGEIATKGSWPWLSALGYRTRGGKLTVECGAALITEKHVLTAAHCVYRRSHINIVRLGEHDLDDDNEAQHEDFKIAETIIHEKYNPETFVNDIAMLKLDRRVSFKDHISPVCLPTGAYFDDNPLAGKRSTVAGWGAVAFKGESSPILRQTSVVIGANSDCERSYALWGVEIDKFRICAGVGGTDACQGDSGGPLVVVSGPGAGYTTVGVVSVGYRCAEPGIPGIYARVTSYLDWIEKNLN